MEKKDKKTDRPLSYPRPSETDNQLQNQPEFIDQQPNDFHDKSLSDLPVNDDKEERKRGTEEQKNRGTEEVEVRILNEEVRSDPPSLQIPRILCTSYFVLRTSYLLPRTYYS